MGDSATIETIEFDWKVSPESILEANEFSVDAKIGPGQTISLSTAEPFENS